MLTIFCQWNQKNQEDNNDHAETELILMTQGLVLAKVLGETTVVVKQKKNIVVRSLDRALLWNQIDHVARTTGEDRKAFRLFLKQEARQGEANDEMDGEKEGKVKEMDHSASSSSSENMFEFVCATAKQCSAWLDALEIALVQYCMHASVAAGKKSSQYATPTSTLGWQYLLVHRPAYTMAVNNQVNVESMAALEQMGVDLKQYLNKLDEYNGFAPLHYAVRTNSMKAAQYLMEIGADPNLKDLEGYTPMYYAVRDEQSPELIKMLELHGATKSHRTETYLSGELFGAVAASTEAFQKKKAAEAASQRAQEEKAQAARNQLQDNIRRMQQRGEAIDEMGQKASAIHEGAKNYADMAKQLKEKSKQQSWF